MASRKDQKQQARQQRLAQEREAKAAAQRRQRMQLIGGGVALVVLVIVVIVIVAGGGSPKVTINPHSKANEASVASVNSLLEGVPQPAGSQIVLGNPKAKVTVTEFGDLECSACDEFDTPSGWQSPDATGEGYRGSGYLDTIIDRYVKTGKVKLIYMSGETETGNAQPSMWTTQQAAANAAALQGKGWNFVEIWYDEQGLEGSGYVSSAFIEGIAKQVPGLDYAKWYSDWQHDAAASAKVKSDNTTAYRLVVPADPQHEFVTPSLWVRGPKTQQVFPGDATASTVDRVIGENL